MDRQTYGPTGKKTLFDAEITMGNLSEIGNPSEKIAKVVDFEMFRPMLEGKLLNGSKRNNAGARPFDMVLMFKIMILQRYYGLGDKQVEYRILDRSSFRDFPGLETGDKVPDEKTVWAFRENLTKSGPVDDLFGLFNAHLGQNEPIFNEGRTIDAGFTVAPRQRNTREENQKIRDGQGQDLWNDRPHKKSHRDIDARWTRKNNENFYGYKNHAKVDTKSKFLKKYSVTGASVHDPQATEDLLDEGDEGQPLYGDSAYTGEKREAAIAKYKMVDRVHGKGYKNCPLTEDQKKGNRQKSRTRARVEQVFGFMEQGMDGLKLRSIRIARATGTIGLINLTYNLFRYEQVIRLDILPVKG